MQITDDDLSEFYQYSKHFMIMSEAGKPIYSRHGDQEVLSPFYATMSAIIHKVQSFFVQVAEREQKNQLRWISSGQFDCACLKKGNFIYLMVINNRNSIKSGKPFKDDKF